MEFRHPSWGTEGPWEMLKHYNISAVMTDSPAQENLQFLSEVIVTADHSFIRFHGRNTKGHYWYNYLYSEQELKPWVEKVEQIREQTKILRIYFNNHYGGKAVINAIQFKEMIGMSLSKEEEYLNMHKRTSPEIEAWIIECFNSRNQKAYVVSRQKPAFAPVSHHLRFLPIWPLVIPTYFETYSPCQAQTRHSDCSLRLSPV